MKNCFILSNIPTNCFFIVSMRRTEEGKEEFIMATKRLKINKSTSALRAVSRLN
jgi:hypothetical protein